MNRTNTRRTAKSPASFREKMQRLFRRTPRRGTVRRGTAIENPLCLVWNLLLVYIVFMACRIVFLFVNLSYFPDLTPSGLWLIFRGGLLFDTSGLLYANLLYIVLMLLPLHKKENPAYRLAAKCVFIVCNALCVIANLADTVYFTYTNRRTTSTVFSEFSHESNLPAIVGHELVAHWYLVLLAVLFVFFLWRAYRTPRDAGINRRWTYYPLHTLYLAAAVPLVVFGIRGGVGRAVRPITVSNANQYVTHPIETALVLNTPFSLIRTIGKAVFHDPAYYSDPAELAAVFNPERRPAAGQGPFRKKNVVVFIVESFGREYIGALNRGLDGGTYRGFTPFVDSLLARSLSWEDSFSNGRKSIDGMPSILSSIPMFVEPFFLTPASLNTVGGLARSLQEKGYHTAFFHGAPNGSMGFEAFARATGFREYYGKTEYDADPNYGGEADFDGTWAVWDEPFLQFFCDRMSEFREPFATAVFTASSHHPFKVPAEYEGKLPEGTLPIHRCIAYTDHALRRFFEKASRQPWYKNTLFVLTADHPNQNSHQEYQTDLGGFRVPILFFAPGDTALCGKRPGIAQQIDIFPTVMGYLRYDRPYLSFGCDLLHTPPEQTYAVNYLNGIYQYIKGNFLLQFDGQRTTGVYDYRHDPQLRQNLAGQVPVQGIMEREVKAIIQQYMERMIEDRLTVKETSP